VPISIAILISGRGSNMKAILEAVSRGELDARVSVVLSNNPAAPGLEVAKEHGIPTECVPSKGLSREAHELLVLEALSRYAVDYVVLAGYMRVLSPLFLGAFRGPEGYFYVINIHPSLLPDFPGACAYDDAFNAGVTKSGITVHLVDEQVDHGPILAQVEFERRPDDTIETFKARGLALEHELFPRVLQQIATQGIKLTVAK
jgi:formyltetrahydrofolate-dependent phosphoribosylglycinamide formyltransferase